MRTTQVSLHCREERSKLQFTPSTVALMQIFPMSQQPEERLSDEPAAPQKARVIPFEKPPSDLQRAVQIRAQERIDAESIKPKRSPVRSILALAVAAVPVLLIFSGFFVAVQAVRLITSLYATPAQVQAPAPEEPEVQPPQPGVVILVPDRSIAAPPPAQTPPEKAGEVGKE